jgi:hypothetical protein
MQAMIRFFAFSCALLASATAIADTIYQSTDKRGNPVFTDRPQPDAKPVELPPINTTPAVNGRTPARQPEPDAFAGYSQIGIGVPSSIPNGLAPTTVGIELQPALQPGHYWQLSLDGAVQDQGTGDSVTIDRLERGTHQLELQVLDGQGKVLGTTSREIFVFWPGGNR